MHIYTQLSIHEWDWYIILPVFILMNSKRDIYEIALNDQKCGEQGG